MTATLLRPPLPEPPPEGARPTGGTRHRADTDREHHGAVAGLVRAARPHQWIKNATVLMVPGLAIFSLGLAGVVGAAIACAAFCLASSSVYLLNDTVDRNADRHHPVKRNRPIASGMVSPAVALGASAGAAMVALTLGLLVTPALGAIIGGYLVLTAAYSLGLKRLAWLDVTLLAVGFVLRVLAGAVAAAVSVSPLLLVAVFAGAGLVALGKRRSELVLLGDEAAAHRSALGTYRLSSIDVALRTSQTAAVVAFGLWVLTLEGGPIGAGLGLLAALGFAGVLDTYRQRLLRGGGGDPSRELLANHALLPGLMVAGLTVLVAGIV